MSDLKVEDFTEAAEPFALFQAWMAEARAAEPVDPEAMALATVDASGLPNVRMILLKGADTRGSASIPIASKIRVCVVTEPVPKVSQYRYFHRQRHRA